ncbi:selenophosphate synthetase, partial [Pantoea rodasii]
FLTKPLGIGILTTAEKKGLLRPEHQTLAAEVMCQLNSAGAEFAKLAGVSAMTDVTGFGLLGHLNEICQGSGLRAEVVVAQVPRLPGVDDYIVLGAVPGGTERNFASYGAHISPMDQATRALLCDPQTSGGLLVAVQPSEVDAFQRCAALAGVQATAIGALFAADHAHPLITVVN